MDQFYLTLAQLRANVPVRANKGATWRAIMTTRIPLGDPATFDALSKEVTARTLPDYKGNVYPHYRVLTHNSPFYDAWLRLGTAAVEHCTLSVRQRMLVLIRMAGITRCAYAWVERQTPRTDSGKYDPKSMYSTTADSGLSDQDLDKLWRPLNKSDWTEDDFLLLTAVDECHRNTGISDATWKAVERTHDMRQMFDLVALVGFYEITCLYCNSFGVEPSAGFPPPPWDPVDNGARFPAA
jgi:hypothetical protein